MGSGPASPGLRKPTPVHAGTMGLAFKATAAPGRGREQAGSGPGMRVSWFRWLPRSPWERKLWLT